MGLCGCFPSCPCNLNPCDPNNGLLTIEGDGDPLTGGWKLCVVETPFSLTNDDDTIEVIPGGSYGHAPHLNMRLEDSDTITLTPTPGGLRADLINAPGEGGGVPTGAFFPWLTNVSPAGYLMMTGPSAAGFVEVADYPALFAVIGHVGTGYVDPLTIPATFKIPDPADMALIGQGTLGGLGTTDGEMAVTLLDTEIPAHDHPVNDPMHDHGGLTGSAGSHSHEPGAAGGVDFVTVDEPVGGGDFISVPTEAGNTGGTTESVSIPTQPQAGPGNIAYAQGNRDVTDTEPNHLHTISGAATGVTVLDSVGGGGAHNNMPPYFVTNFIIKT